ncbi:two-component regulator propeller domain-containing protein [uncultured Bacteroides sp.]|uniref:ligand-binding sensor domain-containing protein n=1 Tax=uncultured Bacteroides sp. TaxID=162156 RepID=UPI0025E21EB5|nr:two-component regulator propeller domain-containing protein [uncultured Bacteroides sp.]
MKQKISCLSILFLLISVSVNAGWQRPVTNYTRHAYKASNQNWNIRQHDNGWIYLANNKGLLEFDGVEWNLYPIHNSKVRAVKIGNDGRIYVGGMGQFGYFTPNRLGGLEYTCLSDSLPSDVYVGIIWNILLDRDRVYFQSDRCFFYMENGAVHKIDYSSGIYSSLVLQNKLYIVSDEGLLMLNGTEFRRVCDASEIGATVRIEGVLPYGDNLLVVTRNNGLFMYDGTSFRKYLTVAEEFCRKNRVFCAALQDSLLALGSIRSGVCLLDLATNEMEVISTENGLQNNTVLSMMFDKTGNLWLGLDNGIDCIHLNARLVSLYGGKPVIGSGYASCSYRDKFYFATNQGLYCSPLSGQLNGKELIKFVPGTSGQIWSLSQHDDKLFCCSDNGIFIIDGERMEYLGNPKGVWRVVSVGARKDVLIAGTYSGLYLLAKKGEKWTLAERIPGFYHSCKDMLVEDSTGILWVGNKENGVSRLTLSSDLRRVEKVKYYNNEDFPRGYDACLLRMKDEVVIASHYGLWRYDQSRDCLEAYTGLEQRLDGKAAYTYVKADTLQNIWYVADGTLKVLHYDPVKQEYYRVNNELFLKGAMIESFENVYFYKSDLVIAGTEEGFSLIRMDSLQAQHAPLTLQIRKVYLTGLRDSLIYGRSYQYDAEPIVIPYSRNSIRIEYSVNDYTKAQPVLYSYQLSGDSEKGVWSEYSENNVKEFTDLHEGNYVFRVKLQTAGEQEPIETSFAFEILPPWYCTWWSYLMYLALAAALFYYVYYRISEGHKRLLIQKKLELYEQEQKFQRESELKDKKIDILKEEKLQSELRYKSEELIRTTLNVVRKNELLSDIKREVLGISRSISEENLVSLRRKTLQLLSQIETNIKHDDDLQAFQTTFDAVHHDFFRKLEKAYPELNNKDKQLCAYIKMNLLSKEIAPLMNISLRGVEISRYRLRKKLGLEEGENLSEFLQKLTKCE